MSDTSDATAHSSINALSHKSNVISNGNTNGTNGGSDHPNGNAKPEQKMLRSRLFVLSAHSESSLATYSADLLNYLTNKENPSESFLEDLSFTLRRRRTQHAWRLALTASSIDQLTTSLSSPSSKPTRARHPLLGYVFTGQGAQ